MQIRNISLTDEQYRNIRDDINKIPLAAEEMIGMEHIKIYPDNSILFKKPG